MVEKIEDDLEYYEMLNRDAIVVKPRRPLFDWANSLTPDEDPVPESKRGKIYLIKGKDTEEAVDRWLRKHFDRKWGYWFRKERGVLCGIS